MPTSTHTYPEHTFPKDMIQTNTLSVFYCKKEKIEFSVIKKPFNLYVKGVEALIFRILSK